MGSGVKGPESSVLALKDRVKRGYSVQYLECQTLPFTLPCSAYVTRHVLALMTDD